MNVPGFPSLMKTDWLYKHRHWFRVWSLLGEFTDVIPRHSELIAEAAPVEILLESMRRIKTLSAKILRERTEETASLIAAGDNTLRRDIMSLLVEARLRETKDGFKMDDAMMLEQFVSQINSCCCRACIGIVFTILAHFPWCGARNNSVRYYLGKHYFPRVACIWLLTRLKDPLVVGHQPPRFSRSFARRSECISLITQRRTIKALSRWSI